MWLAPVTNTGGRILFYNWVMTQFRGVNLGGWLVLESWITPSVFEGFDASDECTLCSVGGDIAKGRIATHRETFITEDTIKAIAEKGLNTVRLPVGYWLFGDVDPYIRGGDHYVDQLFEWCGEYNISVILDIHAAPGSQNGWDHSGRAGSIGWGHGDTLQETLEFLGRLLDRYGDKTALKGLEVLNEPHWNVSMKTLIDYYQKAYDLIRASYPELTILMSDAFRPEDIAKQLQKRRFSGVMLDVHLYQLFTPEDRALDLQGHIRKTERDWAKLLAKLTKRMPVIVGEWSAAMHELYIPTNQPAHVQGYGPNDYQTYFQTQRNLFNERNVSWTYWTARTERGGPWSLLDNPDFW